MSVLFVVPSRGSPPALAFQSQLKAAVAAGVPLNPLYFEPVTCARNQAVRMLLASKHTHLMTVDDDTPVPEDVVERLMRLDADVAVGVQPALWDRTIRYAVARLEDTEWPTTIPREVFPFHRGSLCCALINRSVFERLEFPWFKWGENLDGKYLGEDCFFFSRMHEAGMKMLCDGSVRCGHIKMIDLAAFERE